ncbi:DUF1360 domain-containing protein [Actinokineospora soli]
MTRGYSNGADRPLKGYLTAIGAYAGMVAAAGAAGRARKARVPQRFSLGDTALLAVATHKASRLVSKSSVGSALRAPFVRYERPAGAAELVESARGHGVRHAVGELVTCPFCMDVWVAGVLTAGFVLAPRATRLAATGLTAGAASDVLHLAYDKAKDA